MKTKFQNMLKNTKVLITICTIGFVLALTGAYFAFAGDGQGGGSSESGGGGAIGSNSFAYLWHDTDTTNPDQGYGMASADWFKEHLCVAKMGCAFVDRPAPDGSTFSNWTEACQTALRNAIQNANDNGESLDVNDLNNARIVFAGICWITDRPGWGSYNYTYGDYNAILEKQYGDWEAMAAGITGEGWTSEFNDSGRTWLETVYLNNQDILKNYKINGQPAIPSIYVIAVAKGQPPAKGGINLHKASSNPNISDDNSCYGDFSGVTYDIYDDAGNLVWTLVTDANGDASTGEKALTKGWYHAKERAGTAPKGYAYNDGTTDIEVKAGEMVTANVYDDPQNDPVNVLIKKNSANGEKIKGTDVEKQSQGAATYKGAQFTVYYYDTTDATSLSKDHDTRVAAAKRTWVYETDRDGVIDVRKEGPVFADDPDFRYLVSGEYYRDSENKPTFPIGTYVIEETQAPAGFMAPGYNDRTFIEVIHPVENSTEEHIFTYHKEYFTPTGKTVGNTEYKPLGWNAWYLTGETKN